MVQRPACALANFYPRPPRGGRLPYTLPQLRNILISIHALREEGDTPYLVRVKITNLFLSTPSARRATW